MKENFDKQNIKVVEDAWEKLLKCPQCNHKMIIVQTEPITDNDSAFVPYDTIIECTHCDFQISAQSLSILGSIKNFDLKYVTIASWSPSGSRVISKFEHVVSYDILKKLKNSGELKEFLILNNQLIQVIG